VNPTFGTLRLRLVPALGSLVAATCFAGAPLETVRDCATTASPTLSGLKDLGAVCPDLGAALGALGLDEILYEGWQDKLTAHALHDLIDLNQRYSGSRGVPDTTAVPGILRSLKDEQAPQVVSWWHSFKNWIKEWLEHSDSSIAKWIRHLLDGVLGAANVSPGVLQAFVYIVTILTALAAIVVIVRELIAAGVVSRFRKSRFAINSAENSARPSLVGESSAYEATPAGVLRALVRRLLQTGRLKTERSLTHRELIARTSFDSEEQKAVFAQVAGAAESILYGSQPAAPEIVETVTRQGRELLQQLSITPGAP
jgi:hypothetical protein